VVPKNHRGKSEGTPAKEGGGRGCGRQEVGKKKKKAKRGGGPPPKKLARYQSSLDKTHSKPRGGKDGGKPRRGKEGSTKDMDVFKNNPKEKEDKGQVKNEEDVALQKG